MPSAVQTDGVKAVEAVCTEALSHNVHSTGVVLTILARHREPPQPLTITTPGALRLSCEPIADCNRYESLRRQTDGTDRRDRRNEEAAALRNDAMNMAIGQRRQVKVIHHSDQGSQGGFKRSSQRLMYIS